MKTLSCLALFVGLIVTAPNAWAGTTSEQASPPAPFGKIAPPHHSDQSNTPTLTWEPSEGATGYEYCLRMMIQSWCFESDWVSVGAATSVTVGVAAPAPQLNQYSWQIRARNADGVTEADGGVRWHFSPYRPPGAFSKLQPVSGSTVSVNPTLSWSRPFDTWGAFEYCVDTTNDGSCDNSWTFLNSSSILSAELSGLLPGTTYYWQVRAPYPAGNTPANAGTWWSFTTSFVPNGDFAEGLAGWSVFGSPMSDQMVWNIVDGVFEFYRAVPSDGAANQAVVFRRTAVPLSTAVAIRTQFDLGNSSSVRKRISVLLHDSDFTDLAVCTFWLPPNAPLATYGMQTRPTKAWANATVSFYAATTGSSGGAYRLDNVSVSTLPAGSSDHTECIDPLAPATSGEPDGAELLVNGGFEQGMAGWAVFGQIVHQLSAGVFEFFRPADQPAGVVLQQTGTGLNAGKVLTASFDLGNSSAVRKRVTVLIHDIDFSDLAACTFWLEPGQTLSPYAVRMFATDTWSNAIFSVYAATVGEEQWIRLDNASLRHTPSAATTGTACVGPADDVVGSARRSVVRPTVEAIRKPENSIVGPIGSLPFASVAGLEFESLLRDSRARGVIMVRLDDQSWVTVAEVEPSDEWVRVTVDLGAIAGRVIEMRFAVRAREGGEVTTGAEWLVRQPRRVR